VAAQDRRERGAESAPLRHPPRTPGVAGGGRRPPGDAVPSPEAALLTRESQQRLLEAVERLSDDHRDAVVCRYLLDLSEAETATALGVRRGTVKSRLSRALEQLREELEL